MLAASNSIPFTLPHRVPKYPLKRLDSGPLDMEVKRIKIEPGLMTPESMASPSPQPSIVASDHRPQQSTTSNVIVSLNEAALACIQSASNGPSLLATEKLEEEEPGEAVPEPVDFVAAV